MASKGTFANHGIKIQLQLSGAAAPIDIVNVTSLSGTIDSNREEWVAFGEDGWTSNLVTSKGFTIALEAEYTGNDDLHKSLMGIFVGGGSAGHNGHALTITFPITDPANSIPMKLELPVNLSPSDIFGGDSTGISPMNIEMMVDGKPVYTEETV